MAKPSPRPKARLPRGFRDRTASEIAAERAMLDAIRGVYESYGFEALETPAFEYTDALGKFLPDIERPNEGVFSLQDDDEQWLSLRYDLTAPLARYVAENYQFIPKPFRRYQVGTVWRNEKPGPGRFREFTQFDADTVGTASPSSDAELLMMLADALEAVGLKRGEYKIKVNSRKVLDGVLESAGVPITDAKRRGIVLRALDKFDRLGKEGVEALLGSGRKDESGDFSAGANLTPSSTLDIMRFLTTPATDATANGLKNWWAMTSPAIQMIDDSIGTKGIQDLGNVFELLDKMGYRDRVMMDPSIVRGLDYYTGIIFEAQLTFPVANDKGEEIVMGAVASGGRYDDLVARFTGQTVPACGISVGVSRLLFTLSQRAGSSKTADPLVVVLVLDRQETAASFRIASELRAAGIRAEAYTGESGMKAQMKYADRRGAAIAIIEGSDERARGEVTVKDLVLGAELAKSVADRAAWVTEQPAQISVKREALVQSIRAMLDKRKG